MNYITRPESGYEVACCSTVRSERVISNRGLAVLRDPDSEVTASRPKFGLSLKDQTFEVNKYFILRHFLKYRAVQAGMLHFEHQVITRVGHSH